MHGSHLLKKGIIMTENQETFTRAEVEALLKTLHEQNIQAIRDHYEEERRKQTPPLWVVGVMLTALIGTLTLITIFGP